MPHPQGVRVATELGEMAHIADVGPTLLSAAGLSWERGGAGAPATSRAKGPPRDGVDLWPLLTSEASDDLH